jgi:recombination protein RecA
MAKKEEGNKEKKTTSKKKLTGFDISKDLAKAYGENIVDPETDSLVYGAPTGLKALDQAIGTKGDGGFPIGRLTEIYGVFAAGKSLLGYRCGAMTQQRGGLFILVDSEYAYNPEWGASLGIDNDNLIRILPAYQEDCYIKMMELIDYIRDQGIEDQVTILWDSVAGVETEQQSEGKKTMGLNAKVHSDYLRKIMPKIYHKKVTLIFINQLRDNLGVMFGPKQKTTGGHGIPYFSSLRLDARLTKNMKEGDIIYGKEGYVEVTKSRFGPPFRRTPIRLYFDERGIDCNVGLFTTAISKGALEPALTKAGSIREGYYTVVGLGTQFILTENTFDRYMAENPGLQEAILKYIEEH